jgi:formylglycine-generating enzyme required for sulfatase activity
MGVIWQKGHSVTEMNWSDAHDYCQNLSLDGYLDWRLPTYRELYYLADRTKNHPVIDINYFDEPGNWYWSSTTIESYRSKAWDVYFYISGDRHLDKSDESYVRCVRGGQ